MSRSFPARPSSLASRPGLNRSVGAALAVTCVLGLGLTACGGAQPNGASGNDQQPTAPGSSAPAPAPSPTPDPTERQPGANHNRAAAAYTYSAKDVNAWLTQGPKAANYPSKKIVFLTFDDGPTNAITPGDLDVLKEKGVHATFFYITRQLGKPTEALAQRTIAEGHSIDIHSNSHNYNYLYPGRTANADHIATDYDKALANLRDSFGPDFTPHGFRYPGGHMSWKNMAPADAVLAQRGASWIDWNSMTGDAEPPKTHPKTADGMVKMVQSELDKPENKNPNVAVVLMHDADGKKMTTQALPGVIDWFRSQGYEFGIID